MRFTDRDRCLIRLLTMQLRVASDRQLARAAGGPRSLSRRLRKLADCGLLGRSSVVTVRPLIAGPLACVDCGAPAPMFAPIAWELFQRWETASVERLTINWGSAEAARLFGGVGGRLRQPFQIAHDLLLTDVYLERTNYAPETAGRWLGEDAFRQRAVGKHIRKIPDAVLLDDDGDVERAIEVGGQYSVRRLALVHRHCRRRNWAYEIW